MAQPVAAEKRAQIEALLREPDPKRNEIARLAEVSTATVTKIAKRLGVSFAREDAAIAVRARSMDLKRMHTDLAAAFAERAMEALDAMDHPTEQIHWEDGKLHRKTLKKPTFVDQRQLMTIAGIATQRSLELARATAGSGSDEHLGVVGALMSAIEAEAERIRDQQAGDILEAEVVPDDERATVD